MACAVHLGCTSPGPRPAPAPHVEVADAPHASSPAIPNAARAPSAPEVAPIDIGWARRPQISQTARKLNKQALGDHRKGRYEESRDGFARALADSPDYDLARYNLACALSRLGDLVGARRELMTVLRRDLRRFQVRWAGKRADADLGALRTSPHAAAVDEALIALREAYDEAHDTGVPAYFYEHSERYIGLPPHLTGDGEGDWDHYGEQGGTTQLVAGIYLHAPGEAGPHSAPRFLPLTRDTDVAQLDLPRRRALHLHTGIWEPQEYGIEHTQPRAYLVSTSPDPAEDFAAILDVSPEPLGLEFDEGAFDRIGFVQQLRMGWRPEGAAFDLEYSSAEVPENGRLAWVLAPDGRISMMPPAASFEGGLELRRDGAVFFAPAPAGVRLRGRKLRVDGRPDSIPLDRRYEEVFVGPNQQYAVLLQRRHDLNENDGIYVHDATVTRVDLTTGEIEPVAHGDGAGWVVLAPDGALYVETGGTTRRWPTIDAASSSEVMPRLHITMPRDTLVCGGCG